jgi:dUTPase
MTTISPEVLYKMDSTATYKPKICPHSNGFDLPFQNDIELEPGEIFKVGLQVSVQLPPHYCGLLINKSSAVTNFKLKVFCGLIDTDYTDELSTVIANMADKKQIIPAGNAVVQLLVIPSPIPTFTLCDNFSNPGSKRGSFGSTGQNFECINL